MIKITSVIAIKQCRIRLAFSDGQGGEVDLSDLIGKGVFAPLADQNEFARVSVNGDGRDVIWVCGADLCADELYRRLTGGLPSEFVTENKFKSPSAPSRA